MRTVRHAALLAGVLVIAACSRSSTPPPNPPSQEVGAANAHEREAARFVDLLARGQRPDASWTALEAAAGKFFEIKTFRTEPAPPGWKVTMVAAFERTEKELTVTLDAHDVPTALHWSPSPALLETRTRSIVEKMNEGDFGSAEKYFGTKMREGLPPDKLSTAWKLLEQQAGRFRTVDAVKLEPSPPRYTSIATAMFERTKILVRVVYDDRDEVAGLFFAPEKEWSPPSYAHPTDVEELAATVGEDPALPGNITLPKGKGAVPAVVLVHGSGPADRDEAIGGVRVFKDLALGLASRGIAVLRYDKRSRVSPKGIVTEKDEVVDPAVAAIALLEKTPRVDPHRIFVLGHSQGGNLVPRIAAAAPHIAGYVVMAGNTRPLQDLVVDQYAYFASLHPESEELKKKVEEAKDFKKAVEDPALKPNDVPKTPFGNVGATGAYFLYQRGYDPVVTAKSLALPILVLQGGRDYQVSPDRDFGRWKAALAGTSFATLKEYPTDNHLFVPGSGPPNPEEYENPGHVDERVVGDIADWILKTR